jgi:hypothetical protein
MAARTIKKAPSILEASAEVNLLTGTLEAALSGRYPLVDWAAIAHLLPDLAKYHGRDLDAGDIEALVGQVGLSRSATATKVALAIAAACGLRRDRTASHQAAVHEMGHAVVELVLWHRRPCCVGILGARRRPGLVVGVSTIAHRKGWPSDLRQHLAVLRGGEAAERLVLGAFAGNSGDRHFAAERWELFLRANGRPIVPLDEELWTRSLDLANWALRPNVEPLNRLAMQLERDLLLAGGPLAEAIDRADVVEPDAPEPALWGEG